VRTEVPQAVVVIVGSGEEYGPPETVPTTEDAPLRPQNPYAVSKAASDLLAGFYADAHGLRVVRPRAFNHAGPGQPPLFALASFARQVAAGLEAGDDPVRVVTGNPEARRDFTDVRDVVQAYRRLAEVGTPGVFNVCSGVAVSARELLDALGEVAGVAIDHVVDRGLVRAHEVMEVRGTFARLQEATVDVADHLGLREREQIAVVEQVLAGVGEALAADVGLGHPVAADGGAHGAVDDDDAFAEQRGEWMESVHDVSIT